MFTICDATNGKLMVIDSISSGIGFNPYYFIPVTKNKVLSYSFFLYPSVLIRLDKANTEEGVSSIPLPLYSQMDSREMSDILNTIFSDDCPYYPYPEQKERREMFPSFHLRCVEEPISSDLYIVYPFP